jgi:hypothetical protein
MIANNLKIIIKNVIMTRFIKLTNMLINPNNIHGILIKPNKYIIRIISKSLQGNSWSCGAFGLGTLSTLQDNYDMEVCENKNPIDYKIVSEWINNQ